jgi:hypothetical protein
MLSAYLCRIDIVEARSPNHQQCSPLITCINIYDSLYCIYSLSREVLAEKWQHMII